MQKTQLLLTEECIKSVLNDTPLRNLDAETGVPYGTLRNYRSGRSDIKNMPLSIVQALTEFKNNKDNEFLSENANTNQLINEGHWNNIIEKIKPKFNSKKEIVTCILEYHRRMTEPSKTFPRLNVFVDDIKFFINTINMVSKMLGMTDVKTLIEKSFKYKIRFIFKYTPEFKAEAEKKSFNYIIKSIPLSINPINEYIHPDSTLNLAQLLKNPDYMSNHKNEKLKWYKFTIMSLIPFNDDEAIWYQLQLSTIKNINNIHDMTDPDLTNIIKAAKSLPYVTSLNLANAIAGLTATSINTVIDTI